MKRIIIILIIFLLANTTMLYAQEGAKPSLKSREAIHPKNENFYDGISKEAEISKITRSNNSHFREDERIIKEENENNEDYDKEHKENSEIENIRIDRFRQRQLLLVDITPKDEQLSSLQKLGFKIIKSGKQEIEITNEQYITLLRAGIKTEIKSGVILASLEINNEDKAENKSKSYIDAGNYTNYYIPHQGYTYSDIPISIAPNGAYVTELEVIYRIEHDYVSDLWVELACQSTNTAIVLWANDGCATDCGYDDDYENDYDIYIWETIYNTFDYEPVNQTWYLDVWDDVSGYDGMIDYFEVRIYYNAPYPDLYVNDIWLTNPSNPIAGQPCTINWEVENIGNDDAYGRFYTRMYIDGIFYEEWYTDDLYSGYYTDASLTITLDGGYHNIEIITDYYDDIWESAENNNDWDITKYWDGEADLIAHSIWIENPSNPIGNEPCEIHWEVKNTGNTNITETFYTRMYIDGSYIGEWYTDGLDVGWFAYAYQSMTLPEGEHEIEIYTDATGIISETNENNNMLSVTYNWSGNTNIAPTITLTSPEGNEQAINNQFIITWIDSDPDDNAIIYLYYDTDNTGYNGTMIAMANEDDNADSYTWQTHNIATGTYYIHTKISDDDNPPVYDYSNGTITVSNDIDNGITGTVTTNDTTMINGATILILSSNGEAFIGNSNNGNYEIRSVPAGNYYVMCFADGYIGEFYNNVTDWNQASLVWISDASITNGINFDLNQRGTGNKDICGRIYDDDTHQPLSGVWVYAGTDDEADCVATSDSLGYYTITNLDDGLYNVWATKAEYDTEFYSQDVQAGADNINIMLAPVTTGITSENEDTNLLPNTYNYLEQNYPNPFNPTTTISFNIPNETIVSLCIYNTKGQLVKTLQSGNLPSGNYTLQWNGKDENNLEMPSGVYLYILQADLIKEKRMMLLVQ